MDVHEAAEDKRSDPRFDAGWVPFGYHLVPRRGLARAAAVMRAGELSGRCDEGWREVPVKEQVNHAVNHLMMYLEGRSDHAHLAHAACRVLMALDMDRREKPFFPDPPVPNGPENRRA